MTTLKETNAFTPEEKSILSKFDKLTQINQHIEMCEENGFDPSFEILVEELLADAFVEFDTMVNDYLFETKVFYDLEDKLKIDISYDFENPSVKIVDGKLHVRVFIQDDKDFLLLSLSGLFADFKKLMSSTFGDKVVLFINNNNLGQF